MKELLTPQDQARAVEVGRVFGRTMIFTVLSSAGFLITSGALNQRQPGKHPRSAVVCRTAELIVGLIGLVECWGYGDIFRERLAAYLLEQETSAIKHLEFQNQVNPKKEINDAKSKP